MDHKVFKCVWDFNCGSLEATSEETTHTQGNNSIPWNNQEWPVKSVVWKPGVGTGLDNLNQLGQVLTKLEFDSLHSKKSAWPSPGCAEQQPHVGIAQPPFGSPGLLNSHHLQPFFINVAPCVVPSLWGKWMKEVSQTRTHTIRGGIESEFNEGRTQMIYMFHLKSF